jgi:hypothetical protein
MIDPIPRGRPPPPAQLGELAVRDDFAVRHAVQRLEHSAPRTGRQPPVDRDRELAQRAVEKAVEFGHHRRRTIRIMHLCQVGQPVEGPPARRDQTLLRHRDVDVADRRRKRGIGDGGHDVLS